MNKIWHSVAFRLALMCGILVLTSVGFSSAALYIGTVGVLSRGTDSNIISITKKLTDYFDAKGAMAVRDRIEQNLADSVDADSEIYLLLDPEGRKMVGNVLPLAKIDVALDTVIEKSVLRDDGRRSTGRLLIHQLSNGSLLMVGRDMAELNIITHLILRALEVGGSIAIMLAISGTLVFRNMIENRIRRIRYTALKIEAGNLSLRIPEYGNNDEFSRLTGDLNRMLDRIEHLMNGVKHVSNVIAHNLKTPLGRIRAHLDDSVRADLKAEDLAHEANFAIDEIDRLVTILDKLLQIAEFESGTLRQPLSLIDLESVVVNVVDLYDAAAEDEGIQIFIHATPVPCIFGDKDLIASALSNILDNAFKYAGNGTTITIDIYHDQDRVVLQVRDDGPGIPLSERSKVLQRFYRLDRVQPGYGLGLSIISAIARMHNATFSLEDAEPGLLVRLVFPTTE